MFGFAFFVFFVLFPRVDFTDFFPSVHFPLFLILNHQPFNTFSLNYIVCIKYPYRLSVSNFQKVKNGQNIVFLFTPTPKFRLICVRLHQTHRIHKMFSSSSFDAMNIPIIELNDFVVENVIHFGIAVFEHRQATTQRMYLSMIINLFSSGSTLTELFIAHIFAMFDAYGE